MASAVDEISSILGIPAEGVIEEDELKSPEQCQASMFAARQQLQAKVSPRQSSPSAAVKKVAAIKPQFKSSTLSKKPSSFQAPFKKSDFGSSDIKKPQNIVSPKQRASPDIPKKMSPPVLKKTKTSPMKSPKSPIKSPRRKAVVECSRNSQDTPPQSKSFVEKRDIIHKTVERLKHTQELKSPIRSPPCERQLPTVSSRYHSPSLKRQRGRQVEESAPSPASSGSDEDEPIKKPSVKSPSIRSPTITKPSNILKSPLPKSPVIAQSSPPTKCLRTPPPSSVSPVSPSHPVQDHQSLPHIQSPPPVERISPKLTSPQQLNTAEVLSDEGVVVNPFITKEYYEETQPVLDLEAECTLIEQVSKDGDLKNEICVKALATTSDETNCGEEDLSKACVKDKTSGLSKPFHNPVIKTNDDSQQDLFEQTGDKAASNLEDWEQKILTEEGQDEEVGEKEEVVAEGLSEKELDQKISEQEAKVMESKHSVEEMERQFNQVEELTKSCLENLSQEELEQLSQENKDDDRKRQKNKERKEDAEDVHLSQDVEVQRAMNREDYESTDEEDCLEIMTQAELEAQAQKTEDEIGRQKLEDFFTRKRKEFGINGSQPSTPKGADRPKPLFKFTRKEESDSERKSQEEKSPSHCSAKSPGKFKSTFKALGGGSEEASEGKQSVKKEKGSKEKTQSAPAQQSSKPSAKRKIQRAPQQPTKPSPPKPSVVKAPNEVKPPAKKEVKRKVESSSESSSEDSDHTPAKPALTKKSSNPGRKRRKVYSSSSESSDNEDQFSFNAGNESNEGLWVQCESEKCGKWRLLRGVSDPAEIASTWTCSESTDPKRNKCSAPEENWNELETGYEYVYSAYSMGSLVWCKMQGFPWWPGMVDMDPDSKTFYYKSGTSELPDKYHVTFFGKQPTRAWIGSKSMKIYNPDDKGEKYDQSKSSKGMREAVAMANQAAYLELLDRRNIYGFKEQMGGKMDLPQTKIKAKSTLRAHARDLTAPSVTSQTQTVKGKSHKKKSSNIILNSSVVKKSHKKKKGPSLEEALDDVTAGPSKGRGRPRKDSTQAKPQAKTKAKKLLEKASLRASQDMSLNPDGGEESYIPAPRDVRIKNQLNVIENIENEINQVLRECSPSPTEF